mgnify:CR=1 FL=1
MKISKKEIENYTWNQNIYAALMSGNIVKINFQDKEKSIKEIQKVVSICDNELIDRFLKSSNWRAKLIAACLIGFKNERHYTEQIGENLLNNCGGITGYCYALARFADEKSIYYLTEYLNKYLVFDSFPNEGFQYWVFRALRWTDKINNTIISENYLGENGLWTKFVDFEFPSRPNDKDFKLGNYKQWGNLELNDKKFESIMNFYKDNFEVKF